MNDFHNTAFFVRHPFRIEDLKTPHPYEQRKPFVVVKTIELSKIDYENFIADLCASTAGLSRKTKDFAALTKTEYGAACWCSGADSRMECW